MTACHPTHNTEYRDSSHYEEVCLLCGRTDTPGGWGKLADPCPENIDTSWSKLVSTDMGEYVLGIMQANSSLCYHTPNHVRRIYQHANTLGIEYDINLDAAILFHDAIYDEKPDKERRSADFMEATALNIPAWFEGMSVDEIEEMIMNTAGHSVTPGINPAMIMLDLYELTDLESARKNFEDILDESILLYGITRKEAAKGSRDFMVGFSETIILNADTSTSPEFWSDVLAGVTETINLATSVING